MAKEVPRRACKMISSGLGESNLNSELHRFPVNAAGILRGADSLEMLMRTDPNEDGLDALTGAVFCE